jgi:hypothetical protein
MYKIRIAENRADFFIHLDQDIKLIYD